MNSPNNSDTPRTDAERKYYFSPINGLRDKSRDYVPIDFARTLERELNETNDKVIQLDSDLREANWMLGKCHCGGTIQHDMDEPFAYCDKCHEGGEATIIPYPQQLEQLRADLKMCAEALQQLQEDGYKFCTASSQQVLNCLLNPRIQAVLNEK